MTIHILVEGPSERVLLDAWAPRLLKTAQIKVHPHQGKGSFPSDSRRKPDPKRRGLLDQLPAKLRAFANSLDPEADGVLVLIDADDSDTQVLRTKVAELAQELAGLRVAVTVAIEETEAFYLGDLNALMRAFPNADRAKAAAYVPDSVCGTWELFGEIVGDDGANKVGWAEAMGPRLTTNPAKSRSPSFRDLIRQIRALLPSKSRARKQRTFRHLAKNRRDPSRRR